MKSISLLLLRISTGVYLILWGLVKLSAKDKAVSVSDRYYSGLLSADFVNYGLGGLQVAVGVLVILGLFRSLSYIANCAWYLLGLLPIMPYIIDPFGAYLVESARLTFFPSTTLFFATLVMLAFKEYDTISIDHKRS